MIFEVTWTFAWSDNVPMSVGNQSKRTDKSWPLERVSGCRIMFSNERLEKI